MQSKERLLSMKKIPLSWKELDIITAAERYVENELQLDLVEFILPCFPTVEDNLSKKISQVWFYSITGLHLQNEASKLENEDVKGMLIKASRIYEQESQRILGSIFPINHTFWKSFYQRQDSDLTKPLIVVDALHYLDVSKNGIVHQLISQSVFAILQGHYEQNSEFDLPYERAKRLIVDLPLNALKKWLSNIKSL